MGGAYTEAEQEKGQRVMIQEGLFTRSMESFTGGVILAGFAIALGASDLEIGLIAAIPFFAQLAHIPALMLLARYPDRREMCVRWSFTGRSLFLLIAAIPFVALPIGPMPLLLGALVAYAVAATLSGAAWQVWVRDLVPRDRMGAYFGRRLAILSGVGLVTLLAAGQFVAYWQERFPENAMAGFSLLFVAGGLAGFVSAFLVRTAPSTPATLPRRPEAVVASLKRPLAERNYRRLLIFLAAWGFAANFALPFITVVLLRSIGYSLAVVTLLAALSQVANIGGFRLWAPLTDRFGNKPVLFLSASTFLLTLVAWALLPEVKTPLVLTATALLHIFLGLATSGLDLASGNIVMKLAPEDAAPAYMASASVVKALATGVAPLLGGLAATFLSASAFTLRLGWTQGGTETGVTAIRLAHYDFLFIASALIGLYAIHRLLGFEEPGEEHPQTVVRAMRREVGTVSSVAGMRQFAHVASYLVETAYRFEREVGRGMGEEPVGFRREKRDEGPN